MDLSIRHATTADLARINTIYNTYVVGRHTSFDIEPWTIEERGGWFATHGVTGRYQVLVAELDGEVIGFASSSPHRDKAGYDTSVETTVVLDETVTGRGIGGRLMTAILDRLRIEDIHRVYALIALPNEPSVALHARLGYRRVGILNEVGHKLDRFHSVLIMELGL